jgi:DNA-binding winged helix-turn-helix (wHTH) protein
MLIPERHVLLRGGTPVRLGSRPPDILTVLVERAGELLDKQKIMSFGMTPLSTRATSR